MFKVEHLVSSFNKCHFDILFKVYFDLLTFIIHVDQFKRESFLIKLTNTIDIRFFFQIVLNKNLERLHTKLCTIESLRLVSLVNLDTLRTSTPLQRYKQKIIYTNVHTSY